MGRISIFASRLDIVQGSKFKVLVNRRHYEEQKKQNDSLGNCGFGGDSRDGGFMQAQRDY